MIPGDGSELSPWSGPQVVAGVIGSLSVCTVYIKGSLNNPTASVIGIGGDPGVRFTNWLNEPYRIKNLGNLAFGGNIENAIIKSESYVLCFDGTVFESCIIITPSSEFGDVTIKGSTIISPTFKIQGSRIAIIIDSVVDYTVFVPTPGWGQADNCAFTSVWPYGGANNQNNWTPPVWPAWDAPESSWRATNLHAGINTPPQPGTPPYTGYATDAWGNERIEIGGFSFLILESPSESTSESPSESSSESLSESTSESISESPSESSSESLSESASESASESPSESPSPEPETVAVSVMTALKTVQRVSRRIRTSIIANPSIWLELVNGQLQNVTTGVPGRIHKFPFSGVSINEYESHDSRVGRITTIETDGARVRVNIKGYVPGMVVGDDLVVSVEPGQEGKLKKASSAAPGTYEIVARCDSIDNVNQILTWVLSSPKYITV